MPLYRIEALEKFVAGLTPPATKEIYTHLDTIKGLLGKLGEGESQGVSAMCTKLVSEMDAKTVELKTKTVELKGSDGAAEKQEPASQSKAGEEWDVSNSKKKKKKKKKR